MRKAIVGVALGGLMLLGPKQAQAFPQTFNLFFSGAQEVGHAGDPDATATGTLTVDDVLDKLSWNINYTNLDGTSINGFHIHGPGATSTIEKPVFIGLGTSGTPTLPSGNLTGELTGDASFALQLDQILADPGGFYLNIHTVPEFGGGAIRSALVPEPASLTLFTTAALGLLARRRRH